MIANKKKTKRRGKGGKFEQLKDHDDPMPDDDALSEEESSGSDGVDMMAMRDQYYASQTFSKRLTDTLGDIHETTQNLANAVKEKLSKKEQTVVVPMNVNKENEKQKKNKRPFMIMDDNETTDAFDLSEDNSSNSTQENEYREDSETETRVNLHGKRIKQRMALPTFEDEDDDEVNALTQSHSENKSIKKKKR